MFRNSVSLENLSSWPWLFDAHWLNKINNGWGHFAFLAEAGTRDLFCVPEIVSISPLTSSLTEVSSGLFYIYIYFFFQCALPQSRHCNSRQWDVICYNSLYCKLPIPPPILFLPFCGWIEKLVKIIFVLTPSVQHHWATCKHGLQSSLWEKLVLFK